VLKSFVVSAAFLVLATSPSPVLADTINIDGGRKVVQNVPTGTDICAAVKNVEGSCVYGRWDQESLTHFVTTKGGGVTGHSGSGAYASQSILPVATPIRHSGHVATSNSTLLPDLVEVEGKESFAEPSGTNICAAVEAKYGSCVYLGGGHPPGFPNGKYGYVHRVRVR